LSFKKLPVNLPAGKMNGAIIHTVIVSVFIIFAIHYFIRNSLSKRNQRLHSGRPALLLLYYLPVFIQGFLLLCTALFNFYINTRDFFFLLKSIFLNSAQEDSTGNIDFSSMLFFFAATLLMSLNVFLAGITANRKTNGSALLLKFLYFFYSFLATWQTFSNVSLVFFYGGSIVQLPFYLLGYWPLLIALVCLL
jgi:hypothetical protein